MKKLTDMTPCLFLLFSSEHMERNTAVLCHSSIIFILMAKNGWKIIFLFTQTNTSVDFSFLSLAGFWVGKKNGGKKALMCKWHPTKSPTQITAGFVVMSEDRKMHLGFLNKKWSKLLVCDAQQFGAAFHSHHHSAPQIPTNYDIAFPNSLTLGTSGKWLYQH